MTTSISRRTVVLTSAAVLASTGLAACSQGSEGGNGEGGSSGDVTVWARQNDKVINAQAEAYNKSQSAVKVTVTNIPDGDLLTKYATAIRAGNPPDIIDFDIIAAPLLSSQGVLEDLTSRVGGLSNVAALAPAGVKIGQLQGKTFSLPVGLINSQMFWNKELFRQAGLDPEKPPTSLAEVKDYAEAIQKLGGDVHGFSTVGTIAGAYTGFPSLWADGGQILTDLGPDQKTEFAQPDVQQLLSWYRDMWTAGLLPKEEQPTQDPGGVGGQLASSGKIGIMFTGSYAFTSAEGQKLDLGYADGIPGFNPGTLSAFVGGQNAGITAGGPRIDKAWTFLTWLVSSEEAAKVSLGLGQLPPDLQQATTIAGNNPAITSGLAALKVGQVPASIAYPALINDANGPWTSAAVAIVFDGADPATTLAKAQKSGDELIQQAYQQIS